MPAAFSITHSPTEALLLTRLAFDDCTSGGDAEVAADAVFNFTAFVLYSPAILIFAENELELDPESVKFDIQIASW